MSFSAKLNLGGNSYRVLHFEMEFVQPVDQSGEPSAKPRGGNIKVSVESTKSNEFIEWMLWHSLKKDGELIFNRRDVESEMKKVTFKDAYCVYYKEVFDFSNEEPMVIYINISAREITVNTDQKYESNWINRGGDASSTSGSSSGGSDSSSSSTSSSSSSSSGGISSFNPND